MGKIRVFLAKFKIPLLLSFFLILVLFLGLISVVKAYPPDLPVPVTHVNIGVCVDPPYPDTSDPENVRFSWTTSGHGQVKYWVQVDDNSDFSSLIINTGAVGSSNKFYQPSSGSLEVGAYGSPKTYYWRVAVADSYAWTGWTGCGSFSLENPYPPPSFRISPSEAKGYVYQTFKFKAFYDPDGPGPLPEEDVTISSNTEWTILTPDKLKFVADSSDGEKVVKALKKGEGKIQVTYKDKWSASAKINILSGFLQEVSPFAE